MNQNKLSFESENLVVDYISFNIPGSGNTESIAKYLFEKVKNPHQNQSVVTAAELVCTKSLKQRFADVLMGACMNLVGC